MLLGVTLIVLITHKVTSVLTQGDTSEAVYGWGKIIQEFEHSALLMTEMAMTMMMTT